MKSNGKFADLLKRVLQRRQLYLLLALPLVYLIIFSYIPMFGVQNVRIDRSHAVVQGQRSTYTVHLGSGIVHHGNNI